VTFEDQQKINLFARTNARLQDLKEELDSKKVRSFTDRINKFIYTRLQKRKKPNS